MKIEDHWRRIAGIHVTDVGDIAIAWFAHDRETDTLNLYDCAKFRQQPWAVIGEGISARGKYIPIAWGKGAKAVIDELEKRGLNTVPKPVDTSDAFDEIMSQTIVNRMKTKRFKIGKLCVEWRDEYKTFVRDDAKVPGDSHPLMAATRNAVSQLEWARGLRKKTSKKNNSMAPKLAIV